MLWEGGRSNFDITKGVGSSLVHMEALLTSFYAWLLCEITKSHINNKCVQHTITFEITTSEQWSQLPYGCKNH